MSSVIGGVGMVAGRVRISAWAAPAIPLVMVLIAAVALRSFVVGNADTSWLLTVAERVLDGQRLYVDVLETNPPASILLYLPGVALARALGLAPEWVVDALVFLGVGLSLWLARRILVRARVLEGIDGWRLAAFAAAILTLLPAQNFGEREHIALIAAVPFIALLAARARGAAPGTALAALAGVGAGLAMAIKPHLALGLGAGVLAAAVCARAWRIVFGVENWTAGAIVVLYGLIVVVAFKPFTADILPMVMAVYIAVHAPFLALLFHFAIPLWLASLALIVTLQGKAIGSPPYSVLLAASCGFALAFVAQSKGWAYHSYPMLALAFMALSVAGAQRSPAAPIEPEPAGRRAGRLGLKLATGLLVGMTFCWMNLAVDTTALAEPIRRLAPHPTMLAVTSDIAVGHPLVRLIGGRWVGRVCSLWITSGVRIRELTERLDPATRTRLEAYAARDLAMLTEDIRRGRPEIILLDRLHPRLDWAEWASSAPALAAELRAYRTVETIDDIVILRRAEAVPVAADADRR